MLIYLNSLCISLLIKYLISAVTSFVEWLFILVVMKPAPSLLLCLLMLGTTSLAQTEIPDSYVNQKSIQLNLGTQGIGAEFVYGLMPNLALRGGLNAVPFKANDIFKISDFNSTSHVSADFYNVHALADFKPFKNIEWFRLVGGVAYFFKAKGDVRVRPSDGYTYGDLVLTEDQIGYLDLKVDWKGAAPYLGIALARVFPKKRFNVNLDLGTYYLNQPKATIIGTGLLEGNSSQTGQFQSNIKDYRWLPILQLNFNLKL